MILNRSRFLSRARWLILLALLIYVFSSKWFWGFFYPFHYQQAIMDYSYQYRVDPYLVAAIIKAESRFNPNAESHRGARGLMQIMPETGKWAAEQMNLKDFTPDALYDPETNIKIGCWYINNLGREYEDDKVLMVAAYNAGRGNVKGWLNNNVWNGEYENVEDIPFPETREYVKKVFQGYKKYRWLYGGE